MRGLMTELPAGVVIRGHAFIQNQRRGYDELGVETVPVNRISTAFNELRLAICKILPRPTFPHALRLPNAPVPSGRF